MQRVRVGLTGLAAIFLLVLIAAAGIKPAASPVKPKAQAETLAVLGVAPGSGDGIKVAAATSPTAHRRTKS